MIVPLIFLNTAVISIAILILAVYSLVKGKNKEHAITFAGMCLGIIGLILFDSLQQTPSGLDKELAYKLYTVVGNGILVPTALFFRSFPSRDKLSKFYTFFAIIYLVPYVIFSSFLFTGDWVSSVEFRDNTTIVTFGYPTVANIWHLSITGLVFFLLFLNYVRFRKMVGMDKARLQWVVFGFAISTVVSTAIQLILPLFGEKSRFIWLYPLSFLPLIVATTYSIARYRFMEMRFAARAIFYRTVIAVFLTMFVVIMITINQILFTTTSTSLLFTELLVVFIILALVYSVAFERLQTFFDRFIFRSLQQRNVTYQKLVEKLTGSTDIRFVTQVISEDLPVIFNANFARIYLTEDESLPMPIRLLLHTQRAIIITDEISQKDFPHKIDQATRDYLIKNDIQVLVPCLSHKGLTAILVIGEKKDLGVFRQNEIVLLNTLQYQLGTVIENASLVDTLQSEKDLLETERNKLDLVMSNIGEGVIAVDKRGRVVLANTSATKLLQTNLNELVEKPLDLNCTMASLSTHTPLTTETLFPFLANKEADGVPIGDVYELTCNTNEKRYIKFSTSRISVTNDSGIHGIIMLYDVTEQQQLEMMKLDFVSMAAHELRTPLTSIRGYSEMVRTRLAELKISDVTELIERVIINAVDLNSLIDNILNVNNIEHNTFKTNMEPLLLSSLIQKELRDFDTQFASKSQKVVFLSDTDKEPLVMADKLRISEVYKNLISNAIKYTPPNGSISVKLWHDDEYVYSEVKDNGEGIDPKNLPYLFTKFYRIQDPLYAGSKGTGLGLYIAKSIVQLHGGDIWVESKPSAGSTFTFKLKIATEEEAATFQESRFEDKNHSKTKTKIKLNPKHWD